MPQKALDIVTALVCTFTIGYMGWHFILHLMERYV